MTQPADTAIPPEVKAKLEALIDQYLQDNPAIATQYTEAIGELSAAETVKTAEPATGADRLGWVTDEQRQLLEDEVFPDGGWREQLDKQLDIRWDDVENWSADLSDEQKQERLDNLIPELLLQSGAGLTDEEIDDVNDAAEAVRELFEGKLSALADTIYEEIPEAADLPAEQLLAELHQFLDEVIDESIE